MLARYAGRFVFALLFSLALAAPGNAGQRRFEISYAPQARAEPFSGRVYLFFTKDAKREPRLGPDWFHPEPMLAVDIENWKPDEPLLIDPTIANWTVSFPKPLAELDLAGFRVQAVARFNGTERVVGKGPGNGFSATTEVKAGDEPTQLRIDQIVPVTPFPENRWMKQLRVDSPHLTGFYCRPAFTQGSVLLPASYYSSPERHYPVIFSVPGFGGTHRDRIHKEPVQERNKAGVEFIRVTLDPSCPLGHHVFADSANNGPVGKALIEEFIPELDRQFRTIPVATARFLTGHSSGGWSTLWLQTTYPDTFGGTWSTAPDPVDFRDFQRIDMYRPGENMYRDREGNRRPIARVGGQPVLWYDDFDHMEETLGFGGQLHSFEAVFSPRGSDGRPRRVWDRKTGNIDTAAAELWKAYDIRLILETRWPELGPKLAGKLHVIMGEDDTFYLEGATRLLQESQKKLGSDAVIELVPGKDHSTLYSPELLTRIRSEMVEEFLTHHPVP